MGYVVENLISAVSNALYDEFGSEYVIYVDNVEQDLKRPSFFINVIRPAFKPRIMNRTNVDVPLVIQYFPSSTGKRSECYAVAEQMMRCLKFPEYHDNVYRGIDLKFDIKEDVLNFYVRYNFFTITVDPNAADNGMDGLTANTKTNREDDD